MGQKTDITRHLQAAQGYIELGMFVEASDELECIAPEDRVQPVVVAYRYAIYSGMEKWDLAGATAGLMVKIFPGNPDWWAKWAYATRRCQSVETARSILLDAEKQHPKDAMIQFNLACYACQLGDLEDAKRRVAGAISLDGKFRALALDDPDLEPLREKITDIAVDARLTEPES